MKILIYDCTGTSAQWLNEFAAKENFEIVGTLTPEDKNFPAENSWEYLLVFEDGTQKLFLSTVAQPMKISKSRIIFALDWQNWADHPTLAQILLNPTGGGIVYRFSMFNTMRLLSHYVICSTADNFHYVGLSADVMRHMYATRQNFSADEMTLFYQLAKKYYDVDGDGYFVDVGANIGTTGIYFVKKFAPNLKILAFEPDANNVKMIKTNLILNDMEEKAIIEKFGVGAEDSEQAFYKSALAGAHSFFQYRNDISAVEMMKITSLDSYIAKTNIRPADVKYIWIDTEGFEAQVIVGAKNLLAENPAPLYTEFSPTFWNKSGYYEKMMAILTQHYKSFVFVGETLRKGTEQIYPVEKLWEFQNSTVNRMGAANDELVRENIFFIR